MKKVSFLLAFLLVASLFMTVEASHLSRTIFRLNGANQTNGGTFSDDFGTANVGATITRWTIANTGSQSGSFTIVNNSGGKVLINGSSGNVTTTLGTNGSMALTLTLAAAAEGTNGSLGSIQLVDSSDSTDTLNLTGNVSSADASFASGSDQDTFTHDFGTVVAGPTPEASLAFQSIDITNRGNSTLDLTGITGVTGDFFLAPTTVSHFSTSGPPALTTADLQDIAPGETRTIFAVMDPRAHPTMQAVSANLGLTFTDGNGTSDALTINLSGNAVPEPSSIALFGIALLAFFSSRRKK